MKMIFLIFTFLMSAPALASTDCTKLNGKFVDDVEAFTFEFKQSNCQSLNWKMTTEGGTASAVRILDHRLHRDAVDFSKGSPSWSKSGFVGGFFSSAYYYTEHIYDLKGTSLRCFMTETYSIKDESHLVFEMHYDGGCKFDDGKTSFSTSLSRVKGH